MSKEYEKLEQALLTVRSITDFEPEVALILGSGLGSYADGIRTVCEIPYSDIPGFPVSTVQGHSGKFIFGYDGDKKVVCMKGRVHMYEGYEPSEETKMSIMEQLAVHVASYALPKEIIFKESMPKTLVGKVAFRVLEEEAEKELAETSGQEVTDL